MSGAAPMRERANPRRAPVRASRWPWHDRGGRFSATKLAALALEVLPGLWIGFALATDRLGVRPVLEANHETGLLMIRFLLLTLAVSPARAILQWQRLSLVRRQLGLTALFYGLAHLVLYAWDQDWVWVKIAGEMLGRVYLEIGLVALVGLAVLGVTSTDQALRRLGRGWRRLHRTVHPIVVLAVLHYFLQAKANVGEATLMAGLFVWMMGWRLLPSGADRAPLPLLGLSAVAAMVTAGIEYGWYGLATRIDPVKPLLAELDLSYGPHPAGQVLLLGACFTVAATIVWAAHRERLRRSAWFWPASYVGAGVMALAVAFCFGLTDDWLPEDWTFWQAAAACVVGAAALGGVRQVLPRGRKVLDAACGGALLAGLVVGAVV